MGQSSKRSSAASDGHDRQRQIAAQGRRRPGWKTRDFAGTKIRLSKKPREPGVVHRVSLSNLWRRQTGFGDGKGHLHGTHLSLWKMLGAGRNTRGVIGTHR